MPNTFILISRPSHLTVVILDSLDTTGSAGTHGNSAQAQNNSTEFTTSHLRESSALKIGLT